MNEHEFKVVEQMEKKGGGFVQALAVCFHMADYINFNKLRLAFNDYWKEYEAFVEEDNKLNNK